MARIAKFGLVGAIMLIAWIAAAWAEDRHVGYYYPEPGVEHYPVRVLETLPGSDQRRRVGFVVALTQQLLERPYDPGYAIFAKGADAEKLLIVATVDDRLDTIYRARAFLARLTASSRATPLFDDLPDSECLTFFDLLYLIGFTQLTISDGDAFAHQVVFDPAEAGARGACSEEAR
ncbi:MAG: hypothetical protein ACFB3T_06470 [Geminicoccaceae bacterium]